MSSKTEQPDTVTQPQDAPVQAEQDVLDTPQVIRPKGKSIEDLEKYEWPYTKGELGLRLSHFNVTGLPETLADEKTDHGKLVLVLVSEILRLAQDVHDLKEAVQYMSLQEHLRGKGKGGAMGRSF